MTPFFSILRRASRAYHNGITGRIRACRASEIGDCARTGTSVARSVADGQAQTFDERSVQFERVLGFQQRLLHSPHGPNESLRCDTNNSVLKHLLDHLTEHTSQAKHPADRECVELEDRPVRKLERPEGNGLETAELAERIRSCHAIQCRSNSFSVSFQAGSIASKLKSSTTLSKRTES